MGRHRHHAAHIPILEQRRPRRVGITDALTHVEHLVSDESAMAHRHLGRYLALCGIEVLAASLTDPGRRRCSECAR